MGEALALPRETPRVQVEEIQRSRLLAAAAVVIDEVGYEQTSVQRIAARARVSRRTFYELFVNREECLVALLDEAAERVERELAAAGLEGLAWRERVRGGLWVILSFLDARAGAGADLRGAGAARRRPRRSSVASGSWRVWRRCSTRAAGRARAARSALW